MKKLYSILCVVIFFGSQLPATAKAQIAPAKTSTKEKKNCIPQSTATKEAACKKNAADTKEEQSCKARLTDADKKTKQETTQKALEEKKAAAAPKTRSISVSSAINDKKLDYSKAFFTYTPTTFDVTINDTPIKTDETKSIKIDDNQLKITYYCEFKDGARKSSHVYTYKLNPATTKTSISFDWKKEPRIILDAENAQLLSDVKVDCDKPSLTSSTKK